MDCHEKGCHGKIDMQNPVAAIAKCGGGRSCAHLSEVSLYPCKRCGRLYSEDGRPGFNVDEKKAFLEKGVIVFR